LEPLFWLQSMSTLPVRSDPGHPRHREAGLLALESFGVGPGLVAGLVGGHPGDRRVQLQALARRRS